MKFRTLKADEIECRVATVSDKGCSLLLYKDARVDMNLLDETVGAENWQRKHELINGNLFCNVGIRVDGDWIWKQDVGTESYTEKEKGQASDSFKRACFNWGIGRELYSAPFVWIPTGSVRITEKNGKPTTYDRFIVREIGYDENNNIARLIIENKNLNSVVFTYGKDLTEDAQIRAKVFCYINKMDKEKIEKVCQLYKINSIKDMTVEQCKHYIKVLEEKGKKIDE